MDALWPAKASPLVAAFAALLPLALAGCSDGRAHITGVVLLDGEPIGGENVRVNLVMKPAGGGATGNARVDSDGGYRVFTGSSQGVQPGSYEISVVGRRMEPSPEPGGPPRSYGLTPNRYANTATSGLRLDAVAGSQTFDIELTSDE